MFCQNSWSDHEFVAGIVWRPDTESLLSTSRDGTLFHHAFADAVLPSERANPIGLAININGEVAIAVKDKSGKVYEHDSAIDSAVPVSLGIVK